MATFFTFAMSKDAMNYILIGIMTIIPFLLVIQFPNFRKTEIVIYILFLFMLLSALRHKETFRFQTIFYSLLYILTFIYYLRLIKFKKYQLSIATYNCIIKYLLWAFFLTMVIQQCCSVANIPIFNYRVGEISTFKLNSLASEPSYFGKIVTILMLSYISVREIILRRMYNLYNDFKNDRIIWFIFLYQMLFCGSSFAIILLLVFFLKFVRLQPKTILYSIIIGVFASVLLLNMHLVVMERVSKMVQSFMTFDEEKIFYADQSGAFRIVPTILYIKQFNLSNPDLWFGCGIDYTRTLMPTIMPALDKVSFNVGLFPSFIWDFGIITTIVMFIFVFKFAFQKESKMDILLWFIIILDAPFNTQLFWITLMLMTANKFLQQKYLYEKKHVLKISMNEL
jgi:hypothetical protein